MGLNPAINALVPWRKQEEIGERDSSLWTWSAYQELLSFNGISYPMNFSQTLVGEYEPIGSEFGGLVEGALKRNSLVAACLLTRLNHLTEARFVWRRLRNGRPGPLFTDGNLAPLQNPWPNGTTASLLARMEFDSAIAGNSFTLNRGKTLQRLRPDWVEIMLGSDEGRDDFEPGDPDQVVAGYLYYPGGKARGRNPIPFLPEQIAHFTPIPDPTANYRGLSILSSAVAEVEADQQMSRHRAAFFRNGATVNLAVKVASPTLDEFNTFVANFKKAHEGERKAYKTLFVNQATDIERIGADMQQLEFRATQGAGETRVAANLRVHPVIVGLSEGMAGSSLNAGNYQAARRAFADGTCRPWWRDAAGALQSILNVPQGAELVVDTRDIAFLQEDAKDTAQVQQLKAGAALSLINAGWEPDAVVDYLANDDITALTGQHTGLFSVQLQEPGAGQQDANSSGPDVAQNGNG